MRVLAARTSSIATTALRASGIAYFLFGIFVVFLALRIQSVFPAADPNEAFFEMLGGSIPPWLQSMTTLLLFSALLSTADTEIHVVAVMLDKELSRQRTQLQLSIRRARSYVVVITAVACLCALSFQQLVGIYFFLLYFMMILGPIALACLLGRGGGILGIFGLYGGVTVLFILFYAEQLAGFNQLLIVVPPLLAFAPGKSAQLE